MFRWFALAVFVGALGVSSRQRWLARQRAGSIPRGAEPAALIVGRLIVALPMFGGVFTYLLNPDWMAWASIGIPEWSRWLGVVLGAGTVATVYWVLTTLGSNVSETVLTREHQQLVTTGPYRWVRHPLYGAGISLFVSVGLMASNGFILSWAVVAVIAIRFVVVPREEAELIARFGDEYRSYQAGTGALVPILTGRVP